MKKNIVVGFVMRFKARLNALCGGYGAVIVPELGDRQLTVSDKCGPLFIEAGDTEPVFVTDRWGKKPLPTDEVVLEVSGVNGDMKVVAWGYAQFWKQAEAEIARRPIFRVIRENRFQGQVMSGKIRPTGDSAREEVAFTGNLKQLIAECPRDGLLVSGTDKFAPKYQIGPITALNRFEVKRNGSDWHACSDPRPFPEGPIFRLMYWESGNFRQLALGTAPQINQKFPRGKNDPLAKYTTAGESNGYLYWERDESGAQYGRLLEVRTGKRLEFQSAPWNEVGDPRPAEAIPAKTAAPVKKTSVAMPKSAKPRQFSMTVKSLDGLVLA